MTRRPRRGTILAARVLFGVALLIAWELAADTVVKEFYISRPTVVAARLWDLLMSGSLLLHTSVTALHALGGFFLGGGAGILFALVLGRMTHVAEVIDPYLMAFYSLPKVALAPLFILWFGIGMTMKILFVATIVFFLVFLNTYTGIRNVSREQITIMRLMGASEMQLMSKLILPAAFAWVFAGLQLSVPYALIGAIVGELIASNVGLGYLLADASSQFNTGTVFAALFTIALLAMGLNAAVGLVERLLMPWKTVEERREATV
jgi:NitT/TauT family transport system permease protein